MTTLVGNTLLEIIDIQKEATKMIFLKKQEKPLTVFESEKFFRDAIDRAIGQAQAAKVDIRTLADALERAAQGLRGRHAVTTAR